MWLCTLWLEATCWATHTQVPSCSRAIQLSKEPSHGKLCLQVSMNKIRGYYPPTSSVSSSIHWTGSLSMQTSFPSPPIHNSLSLYHRCIQAGHLQSICHLSHLCSSVLLSKEWGDGGTISTVLLGSTDTNSKCSKPTEALDTACVYT